MSLAMDHTRILQKASHAAKLFHNSEVAAFLRVYDVEASKSYYSLQCTSFTSYLESILKFTPAVSNALVTVVRKSILVPELKEALARKRISMGQARIIASVITSENSAKWFNLCACLTFRDLERRVAQESPEIAPVERVKFRAKDQVVVTVTLKDSGYSSLERGQQLLKQSTQAQVGLAESVEKVFAYFVEREDPVIRAERKDSEKRTEKDKVMIRDQGSCQHQLSPSHRCNQRYWIDIHHIKPRSEGGTDTAENLITLCSGHHRMKHESTFYKKR
jgi:hypothetical protein